MLQQNRVDRLAWKLRQENIDAALIGPTSDLEYLSGLNMFSCERFKGLFVLADGRSFCISPHIYLVEFRKEFPESTPIYVWEDQDWFFPELAKAFSDHGLNGKRLAVNDGIRAVDAVEIMERQDVTLINGWHLMDDMRIIKAPEEIAKLKEAGRITDAALEDLRTFIKPGMTEKVVKKRLVELFEEHGAQGLSFEPIVARGENGAMPHYNREDGVIMEHDTVLIDFGCRFEGYCSDMTRTVVLFVGDPTDEGKKLYDIVLEAQKAGEAMVKPGVAAEEVDRAARGIIEKAGYGEWFNNRVGHGIGVAIHEAPFIMEGNKTLLKPGMVFSVEPGIYIPGKTGIRVENCVVVTENGCESMTHFPREIVRI